VQLTRPAPPHPLARGWAAWRRAASPYLYLLPALTFLGVFTFYPLFQTVQISLYNWNLVSPNRTFVGLDNYLSLLGNPEFAALLTQTFCYLLLALIGNFLLPVGLALLTLQVGDQEADLYQALLFLPTVVAVSIGTLIWLWFFLPAGGLFNTILGHLGLRGPAWLTDARVALPAVALVANWKFLGFNYLIALAGLRALPKDYLEAARIDGATGWQVLRYVIVPLFSPSALFLFLSTLLLALENVFVPIDILTAGGPFNATSNLMYSVYQNAFRFFRAGQGAAESVVLILLFATLILAQFRLLERSAHYDR
jgi:ABC-type sugar transport system permease subunit